MRFLRIFIFSLMNIILFVMFKKNYEIIYHYYFGLVVFIPIIPILFIYIPLFIFQFTYQLVIIYELLFKKFITRKANFLFTFPIILIMITLNKSPFESFEGHTIPAFKIQELMFKIQTNLEEYRVNTKYYPKAEDRFTNKIISKIPKDSMLSNYTIKGKKVKTKIIYIYDQIGPYNKNIKKYNAPSIIVTVGSSGKKYWITAVVKDNYIKGKNIILNYNSKQFILKEDILIRDRLRNHEKVGYIYNQLINSIKK